MIPNTTSAIKHQILIPGHPLKVLGIIFHSTYFQKIVFHLQIMNNELWSTLHGHGNMSVDHIFL